MRESRSLDLSKLNVMVVSHIGSPYGPTQALEIFLRRRAAKTGFIKHPLSFCEKLNSICTLYDHQSKVLRRLKAPGVRVPEVLIFFLDALLTIYFTLRLKTKFEVYVGIDCLNAFIGLLLRKVGIVRVVIFYTIDYTPTRFENPIKNAIYHFLDKVCIVSSDYIWNLSRTMAKLRRNFNISEKKNMVVPVGVDFDEMKQLPPQPVKRRNFVFVGHMQHWSGLPLLLDALPEIIAKVSDVKLELIGGGPMEEILKKRVEELGIREHVDFLGWIPHERVLEVLMGSGIAVALFKPDPINKFCDPIKIKEYLACGCPVILTAVPDIAYEIRKKGAGIAIKYDKKEFVEAALKLLIYDSFFEKCKKNAIKLGSKYNWEDIFEKAFNKSWIPRGNVR